MISYTSSTLVSLCPPPLSFSMRRRGPFYQDQIFTNSECSLFIDWHPSLVFEWDSIAKSRWYVVVLSSQCISQLSHSAHVHTGEFYSLVRFLRLDPMAFYYCRTKGCDCKNMHYRITAGVCEDCGHGGVQHFSHFNKYGMFLFSVLYL
jgi:hypothetical protein